MKKDKHKNLFLHLSMKNNNFIYTCLFSILLIFLFLPIIQKECNIFKIKDLEGVTIQTEKVCLNFSNFSSAKYQVWIEKHLSETFAFREPIIRFYNQCIWTLFGKTHCENVSIGKDHWLFNEKSVKNHYEGLMSEYANNEEQLIKGFDRDISLLKKLQDMLKEHGTEIFVLMLPSKDLIYPEYLPNNTKYQENNSTRAYDYYSKAFAENGIQHLDIVSYFKKIKDKVDYPLFPKAGMHWSNIACAHASDTIIRYMEYLCGKNFPNIEVGKTYLAKTRRPDNDMARLLNIASQKIYRKNYYADVDVIPDLTAQKAKMIVMGDSFFWNMSYTLPMNDIFEYYHYWYYFNTIYYDSKHNNVSEINLAEELKDADVVMISLSATQLYDINHGFISQSIINLSLDDNETIDSILTNIKNNIKNDESWYNSVKNKAKTKGISVEEALTQDAIYILNLEPEKYL